jgi:hypothetical protein
MATFKRVLIALLVGAGVGTMGAMLIAPGLIEWYSTPAVPNPTSCGPQIEWALSKLRFSLTITSGVCALVAVIVAQIFHVRRSRRLAAGAAVTASSATRS